jgi:hypothetical protein
MESTHIVFISISLSPVVHPYKLMLITQFKLGGLQRQFQDSSSVFEKQEQ